MFRSGHIASRNGIEAQGIGSKTKKYFWMNAFIRELTAIMHYEKKFHFKVAGILFIVVFFMGSLLFISNVIKNKKVLAFFCDIWYKYVL